MQIMSIEQFIKETWKTLSEKEAYEAFESNTIPLEDVKVHLGDDAHKGYKQHIYFNCK